YRKASYRTHSGAQRYQWKYRGRYGTKRVRDFMKRLTKEEQNHLKEEVEKKLTIHKGIQQKINHLLEIEPFNSQYKAILNTKNRIIREHALRKFYSKLNSIVRKNEPN
ncbi:hypothetical protein, partial [Priestia megaterium]|uniref:hypothetical protein n=1 Tax=Priestia megaterium TaxID=1404 RepID=UPI0018849645